MPTLSDAAQLTAAQTQFALYVQTSVLPTLDTTERDAILAAVKRASTWVNNTAYVVGDVVMPTVRNGHRYRCIVAGTSEALLANEPEWPTLAGAVFTEGASNPILTWVEDGPEFSQLYDLRAAYHRGWMLKAAKASVLYETRQSQSSFAEQQVYEHCLKMAEKYGSADVA